MGKKGAWLPERGRPLPPPRLTGRFLVMGRGFGVRLGIGGLVPRVRNWLWAVSSSPQLIGCPASGAGLEAGSHGGAFRC